MHLCNAIIFVAVHLNGCYIQFIGRFEAPLGRTKGVRAAMSDPQNGADRFTEGFGPPQG
jgi:hypothetical protein